LLLRAKHLFVAARCPAKGGKTGSADPETGLAVWATFEIAPRCRYGLSLVGRVSRCGRLVNPRQSFVRRDQGRPGSAGLPGGFSYFLDASGPRLPQDSAMNRPPTFCALLRGCAPNVYHRSMFIVPYGAPEGREWFVAFVVLVGLYFAVRNFMRVRR
jgi:hypothetical protein